MKKIYVYIIAILAIMTIAPLHVSAKSGKIIPNETAKTAMESARASVLLKRLDEIKDMDKSSMNRMEKKEARKEVRSINKELKSLNNGVYISVGAIIIILLLLIILL